MGNFYTNYTIRNPNQEDIARFLAGRKAVLTPAHNGYVVVFDEQSDEQDQEIISELASRISREFRCAVLVVLNHDDDVLWFQLFENGKLTDEYDSSPGYFDPDGKLSAPVGGNAQYLAAVFGATDVAAIEVILRKLSYSDDGYSFAFERHADLVRALGLPEFSIATSYASFEHEEYPEGLSPGNIVWIS